MTDPRLDELADHLAHLRTTTCPHCLVLLLADVVADVVNDFPEVPEIREAVRMMLTPQRLDG
jgi:hypothetical protein